MLSIDVPGHGAIRLAHLVCDYNGTLARDGYLIDGVAERLAALAGALQVHVLTADTFGRAKRMLGGADLRLSVLGEGRQDEAKGRYVTALDAARTAAIGNGRNDRDMVAAAALGIVVLGPEGAAGATAAVADVLVADVLTGLDLLLEPRRLVATLRR